MKRIILLFFLTFPTILLSQSEEQTFFNVSGKIIDSETKKPLEAASIIFRDINNKIKFGGITNQRGNFSIEVAQGNYNVSVEYISYKTKKLDISNILKNSNIGTIELSIDTQLLNEIEIVAEKKTIEIKPKKMVVNVSKDIVSSGGLATDVLNNIPSVEVDTEGNVSLRGSETTVMINGKISPMSKGEALKSIAAGSIEKIEVITNPGVNYTASYKSIVNIILKKGKDEGFNASITATGGFKDIYGGLLTLNYKTKKYNFYTTSSYGHSKSVSIADYKSEYFENGTTSSYLNESNETSRNKNNWYGLLGVEIYISDNTTLTPQINYTNLNNKSNSETFTEFLDNSNLLQATNNRFYNINFNDDILEYSINLEHNFNENKNITANFSYYNDTEDFDRIITNTNSDFTDEDYIEKNKLKNSDIDIKYNQSINDNKAFALGYKGEFGSTNFLNTEIDAINSIDYIEDSHAVFAEFENQIKKFYYAVGLRAESNKIKINYKDLNSSNSKEYNDLFPAVYLGYDFNDYKSLFFSSTRSISRPNYETLQPFEQKTSETSSYIGNESLEPLYIYQNDISYTYSGKKITIIPALMFNIFDNYWQNVTYNSGEQFNGVDKLITTYANVGDLKQYGLNVAVFYSPTKTLNFSGNILLNQLEQKGVFKTINNANQAIEIDYTDNTFTGNLSLLTQIKLPKLFNFQTNITHFLESEGAVSKRKAYTYVTAALTKELFNNNATISLNVDDLFLSRETNRDRYIEGFFQKTKYKNKYRTIKLSFTYRFNQSKKQRKIDFDKKDIQPNY